MQALKYIAVSVLFPLLIAITYVFVFSPSETAFAQIMAGDSREHVNALMNAPQYVERHAHWIVGSDYEYLYYLRPIPVVWVVGFKNDRVIGKTTLQSP